MITLGSVAAIPTCGWLVWKEIYHIDGDMVGMIGATVVSIWPDSYTTKKSLVEFWAQPVVRARKWPNGYSRPMAMWCPGGPSNPCRVPQK